MFRDRSDAGKVLAKKLEAFRGKDVVVLALPRGGVIPGYEIAKDLELPLDIVVVRKVGHPDNPEYALCAVDEKGERLCGDESKSVDAAWLAEETDRQIREARRRVALYRGGRAPVEIRDKIAIIVDDGIATGLSMRLAVRSVKAHAPARVIIAVPVAPLESIQELKEAGADEVIVLEPPEEFLGAVGAHYVRFDQVQDGEVVEIMQSL